MVNKSRHLNRKPVLKTKKQTKSSMLKLLKNQTGGANNTQLLFLRDDFKSNFDVMHDNLVLYKSGVSFNTKIKNIDKHLSKKLDSLMTLNDNNTEVDLSFINEVYSFPYLDVAGHFAIKKTVKDDTPVYEFINKDNLIYDIKSTLSHGTGAGDILLLTKKDELKKMAAYGDYPEELVLKLYNKNPINVKHKKSSYNNYIKGKAGADYIRNYGYSDYTAYSSLKIFDISEHNKYTFQTNCYQINFDTFLHYNKAFDLNEHNCLIENYNIDKLELPLAFNSNNNSNYNNARKVVPVVASDFSSNHSVDYSAAMREALQNLNSPASRGASPTRAVARGSSPARAASPTRAAARGSSPARAATRAASTASRASSTDSFHSAQSNVTSNVTNINYVPVKSDELVDKDKRYIYLAASYDDFINEYIQQVIMKTIIKKYDDIHSTTFIDNIMNFYNAMVIPIEELGKINYYGCLVMEKVDGNVYNFMDLKIDESIRVTNLIKCIADVNNVLKVLKNKNNCFCHTDLKIENVFYKKISDDNYRFILADYDKSSITYNKIRFYNQGIKIIDKYGMYSATDTGYGYDIDKTNKTYKITRHKLGKYPIFENFEYEQLYLRYNAFPTIMKFDINMFIVSIYFNQLELLKNKHQNLINTTQTITGLRSKIYSTIREQYSSSIKDEYKGYKGNFGELLFYTNILNDVPSKYDYELPNFYNTKCINLTMLSKKKKIIISRALCNIKVNQGAKSSASNRSTTFVDKGTNVQILFTGNYQDIRNIIYKTNRYSSNLLLYEWDKHTDLTNTNKYNEFWNLVIQSVHS